MNCPVCDATLRTVTKHNVEVDICPDCKGVWLDRGELDKIIEIASRESGGQPVEEHRESREPRLARDDDQEYRRSRDEHDRRDEREHDDRGRHGKDEYDPKTGKRRRGSMLGEIFDMFGGD